jgi:hypothetical protein
MASWQSEQKCSNVAVSQAETFESTALSAHQVLLIDFQQALS